MKANRPAIGMSRLIVARSFHLMCAIAALAMWSGCNSTGGLLPIAGENFGGDSRADAPATGNPAPTQDANGLDDGDSEGAVREIEEADVLKIVDGYAYVLNQFKGLIIIDVKDPKSPSIVGRLEFLARPVEMFVVGTKAYVVSTNDYYYGLPYYYEDNIAVGIAPPDGRDTAFRPEGSKVTVIDITDKSSPKAMDNIELLGYATASRRVGNVLYVVGSNAEVSIYGAREVESDGGADVASIGYPYSPGGFVASINVADPDNIVPVERLTFDTDAVNLHVSTDAMFATSYGYNAKRSESTTLVQYVDISDAAGKIVLGDTIEVPGTIRNRFYLDDFEGVLRVATESFGFGFQKVRVFTYDLADKNDIKPLGEVEVIRNESLEAVRFDGNRGYVVTFERVDPLFVLDLSDPANPKVTGELEVPGFSTHIEPRGDRLIATGIDDTEGRRPAVVLYDVSDPSAPKELSRIILGAPDSFTESAATWDEKAFKVVEELDLILMPFRTIDYDKGGDGDETDDVLLTRPFYYQPDCVNGVQVIDYRSDALTQRGWFKHRGNVERVGAIGEMVYAMSQLGFQTVDIENRDAPKEVATVEFLSEEENGRFDDCGGYYHIQPIDDFPIDDVIDFINRIDPGQLAALVDAFLGDDGTCGTMGAVFPAGMVSMFAVMHTTRRRRLSRRNRR